MALKTASIPISDHNAEGVCTSYYMVRYKASYDSGWKVLTPNPVNSPVSIPGLAPSTTYNLEITRYCCDGTGSSPMITTFTTTE